MILQSILDTDLYKFTTSYAYLKLYPEAQGIFEFHDRDGLVRSDEFLGELESSIKELSRLRLSEEEMEWAAKTIKFIPRFYWEWLMSFKFNPSQVHICLDEDRHLHIRVGSRENPLELYKVTLYEIAILAIVSRLTFWNQGQRINMEQAMAKLEEKIVISNESGLSFSDMGTRRRYNFELHDKVISRLTESAKYFNGTSNCYLAKKYGIRPIGTYPHEWPMFHGAVFGYREANVMAMEDWVKCYDGYLGIALSDTYTSDVFFANLSRKLAALFDGIRQDSGDEIEFTKKAIKRYLELGIDPSSKTIIFSNSLNFPKALRIMKKCEELGIKAAFGIGTNLTCDTEFPHPNIVMKLVECRINPRQPWSYCVKLSDDRGKTMGNKEEVKICKATLRIR